MESNQTDWFSVVLGFATVLVLLVFIGWLSGRILGVKRGFFRAMLAGLVGFVAGATLIAIQFGSNEIKDLSDIWALGLGFFSYVLVVTLLASVAIDAIARPRSQRRRLRIPHPILFRQ